MVNSKFLIVSGAPLRVIFLYSVTFSLQIFILFAGFSCALRKKAHSECKQKTKKRKRLKAFNTPNQNLQSNLLDAGP